MFDKLELGLRGDLILVDETSALPIAEIKDGAEVGGDGRFEFSSEVYTRAMSLILHMGPKEKVKLRFRAGGALFNESGDRV